MALLECLCCCLKCCKAKGSLYERGGFILKFIRCWIIILNFIQAFASSMLLAVFSYTKLILDDMEIEEWSEALHSFNGVLWLGLIIGALILLSASLGTIGLCRSSILAIEAYVVMLCVLMTLEASTAVEIFHLGQPIQEALKSLSSASICPICLKLMSPEGIFRLTAWILLVVLALQVLMVILAVSFTLKAKNLTGRNIRVGAEGVMSDEEENIQLNVFQEESPNDEGKEANDEPIKKGGGKKIYRRFANDSIYSSSNRKHKTNKKKSVTFISPIEYLPDPPSLSFITAPRLSMDENNNSDESAEEDGCELPLDLSTRKRSCTN